MIVLYVLLAIILVALLLGLVISKDLNYEQSIDIDASAEEIWPHVSSHEGMDQWNPWHRKDPDMKRTLTGTDGTVGACSHWVSDVKGVGEGKQTFTKLEAPSLAETELEFIKPFKSIASGYLKIQKGGSGKTTNVTWGFESQLPYPMNLMKLFMNFEKSMGKDFGEGLAKLKEISEK